MKKKEIHRDFMIKTFSYFFFLQLLFLCMACSEQQREVKVKSPDGNYVFVFQLKDQTGPSYSVQYKGKEVIANSGLGFEMMGDKEIGNDIRIDRVINASETSSWKPVYGEKNEYPDAYEESLVLMAGKNATFDLRIRAYNEGVAFRYEFSENGSSIQIQNELTAFSFPKQATAWASNRAQSEILKMPVSDIKEAMERPLLVQLEDSLFVAIGEAALVNYARMKFVNQPGKPGTLVSELSSEVISDSPMETPWRFIMAAEKPGMLLENNYLLLNLNQPNKITDPSWIKPGKVIREVTLTDQGARACVDFAAKHNLQFVEFDAGWYGNEYNDSSDATTITVDPKRSKGPLDLLKIIDYAKSKDIGIILYVNRRSLEKQLDEVLPLLQSWGIKGVKYGFVNVGPQEWTGWLHEAVRKAADHNLMVDVHDEYRPTGYSRTYPNLMTQEGIRGDEESAKNSMVLNTLFSRMIAGAGDQTNCYFASRVTEKMGSHASQLAKAVCIYSPWQFLYWYDRPKGARGDDDGAGGSKEFIQEVPELSFYDAIPTVWDDTKVLDGYPGEYAIIARRSGNDWFIGALTGDRERMIEIPLNFLDKNRNYEAVIYSDDETNLSVTKVDVNKRSVSVDDVLKHNLKKQNGLAIHVYEK